ncbi:MAG: ABC transporter ATP-binding protein [Acidimicrobiia bacterium]|nr:ABC transporter ATP-binding protein [Microthrixaceae bacterium]MCB9402342.1 ABC transporter ATP-binding protein [Microthrixaceae bacterium]MCO5306173.1 ABC transporter ATP-binding protein [Microthrixaceae bacterium]RTL08415.1 MAG: ABC transporter ATP-binding protein [Acidimicrobiia bacterium]HPG15701.1 ABC transporter ATP-binding protein [Microthrixaceae bacterium]
MEQPTTPTGPDVVLRASRLRKDFGDTRAVDDVSITIHAGERVGIVGPNGAGKTTTLLMLLGAIEPDHGTIDIAGHRLPGGRSDAMTRVGFAAGYLPLPSGLTVTETLELFGRLYGVADPTTRAAEVLDELHIGRLAGQKVESLSSGQGTLVGFAKAVIHHPRLIVLDEPTASLDPDVAMRVRDRLEHMNSERNATLLLTSHDMREVAELTTRVIFLRQGTIIADGPPDQVVASHGHADLESMFLAEAARVREQEV